MTELDHVNFDLSHKFDGIYEVILSPGGIGFDLYEVEDDHLTHIGTFGDLMEVASELLD